MNPIQTAIDNAIANKSTALLPSGTFEVVEPIRMNNVAGLRIVGAGAGVRDIGTRIIWKGDPEVSMWQMAACRECYLGWFCLSGGHTGIESWSVLRGDSIANIPHQLSTNITFDNIYFHQLDCGVRLSDPYQIDANNDWHKFINCNMSEIRQVGYSIEHGQAKQLMFRDGSISGHPGHNAIGIDSIGSQHIYNLGGGHLDIVVRFRANDTFLMSGGNWENVRQLAYFMPGGYGTPFPIKIENIRFSLDNADGEVRFVEDSPWLELGAPGPVFINNVSIDGKAGRTFIRVWHTEGGTPVRVYVDGGAWNTTHETGIELSISTKSNGEHVRYVPSLNNEKTPYGIVSMRGVYNSKFIEDFGRLPISELPEAPSLLDPAIPPVAPIPEESPIEIVPDPPIIEPPIIDSELPEEDPIPTPSLEFSLEDLDRAKKLLEGVDELVAMALAEENLDNSLN